MADGGRGWILWLVWTTATYGECCVQGLSYVGGSVSWEFGWGLWVELEEECCCKKLKCSFCNTG